MAFHPVHYGNRIQQCNSFSSCSVHQERDDTGHLSLQETHPHWPISQLQI
jgi:hypothetical protein